MADTDTKQYEDCMREAEIIRFGLRNIKTTADSLEDLIIAQEGTIFGSHNIKTIHDSSFNG